MLSTTFVDANSPSSPNKTHLRTSYMTTNAFQYHGNVKTTNMLEDTFI